MTAEERKKIVSVISAQIKLYGSLKLSYLSRTFMENGIDRSVYAGVGPKKWIPENFPEFKIEGNNGLERIVYSETSLDQVRKILKAELDKNGRLLLAEVPGRLAGNGIQYKELAHGQKLGAWLISEFPEFVLSEDNLWLLSREHLHQRAARVSEDEPIDETVMAEIQQMHTVAFMNWWSVNVKKLKAYNELLEGEAQVKNKIAHQLARVLLGEKDYLIDGQNEKEAKVAFDTGIVSDTGFPVYCILAPNPKNTDGTKQSWALLDFSSPDQDTPLGKWLKAETVEKSNRYSMYTELEENLSEAENLRIQLIPAVEKYLSELKMGILPVEGISGLLVQFENVLQTMHVVYEEVWGEKMPENMKLEQLMKKVGENNIILQQIESALDKFDSLAVQVEEMFQRDKLSPPEEGKFTTRKDMELLHRCYDQMADGIDLTYFKKILRPYRALLHIMASDVLSAEVDVELGDIVCVHFPEILYRFAVRTLMGSEESDYDFLRETETIEKMLEECEAQLKVYAEKQCQDREPLTVEELLGVVAEYKRDGIAITRYARMILPEEPMEHMLVFAEKQKLLEYIQNSEDNVLNSPAMLSAIQKLPTGLTYYFAAERLYQVNGNKDRLAEKYYILGLAFDEKYCAAALLKLYREENNKALFEEIYKRYFKGQEGTVDDQVFYLEILCEKSPEMALRYVHENYWLFYLASSLDLLLKLPEGFLSPQLREKLQKRRRQLQSNLEHNEIENAIINRDYASVERILEDPEEVFRNGYSDEERLRMEQALKEETEISGQAALCTETDYYTIGTRLYRFQKNRHGLAENYMWRGIASDKRIKGVHLMLILAQEGRWEECCELYERFEAEYSENADCRQAYFVAAVNVDYKKAQEYIIRNLQECLGMLSGSAIVKSAVQEAALENAEQKEFYSKVLELGEYLEDPLLKSVVLLNRTLREYATSIQANEQEISDEIVRRISAIYQSNNYSHGTDAASVAERVFSFLGIYRGITEKFAEFALPDPKAVNCLWEIYSLSEDEELKFELLEKFPNLKESHLKFYLDYLFSNGKYSAYIEECGDKYLDCGENIQKFIALMKINSDDRILMPSISDFHDMDEANVWFEKWGGILLSTLLEKNRIADAEDILFECFEGWMDNLTPQTIKGIVTGEGEVSREALAVLQERALASGRTEIALYFYHEFGIGNLKEVSNEFVQTMLKQVEIEDDDQKIKLLNRLQIIDYGSGNEITVRLSLLRISQIKSDEKLSSEEKGEKIANVIREYPVDEDAVRQLLPYLEDENICWNYEVYTQLEKLSEKFPEQEEILRYFYRIFLADREEEHPEFKAFACRCFINAFHEERFPEDLVSEVSVRCTAYVKTYKNVEGLLCLYFAELTLHREAYAQYLLRVLADISNDATGKVLDEIISEQLQVTWKSSLPGFFDLFKSVLNESSLREIRDYIAFANSVGAADSGDAASVEDSVSEKENNMLSEQNSSAMVRQLFANPEDAGLWRQCTKLPLQDFPPGCAKLLYLASEKNTELWKSCADYCEKYEQNDLLLSVLVSWAASDSNDLEQSEECRKYLEERLMDSPEYFLRWKGNEKLLELSNILCNKVKLSEVEYHSALRALSLIAVESGFPEAVDGLFAKFGNALLGTCCNLSVVIMVRLLLAGRCEEARKILIRLGNVLANMNYRELVEILLPMTTDEIASWAENAENRIMMQMVLPDGNSPKLQQINAITYEGIKNEQEKETASVLCQILDMFKNDYGAYNALYDVCCTQFDGFLPILHMALRGLVRLRPGGNAWTYYRRNQKEYAKMLAILDALLVFNGKTKLIKEYDFNKTVGEYYRMNAGKATHTDAMEIQKTYEDVISTLKNRSPEEVNNLSKAYLGVITGNWTSFLKELWKDRADVQLELGRTVEGIEDVGFAKSILRVLTILENDQRPEFIQWLRENTKKNRRGNEQEKRWQQVEFVSAFYQEGYFDELNEQTEFGSFDRFLKSPFEDYSYANLLIDQYLKEAVNKSSEHTFAIAWLIGALVCHSGCQTEIMKLADQVFEQGNDKIACDLYHSLYRINRSFKICHFNKMSDSRRMREQYEAKYRLTALFSGNHEMAVKVGSSDFHVWSCINLVLSLAYSSRANEIRRLESYLGRENANLAEALLKGLNPEISDLEKLGLIDSLNNDVEKVYFCYVLKYPYNPFARPEPILQCVGLTDREAADEVNRRYRTLTSNLSERKDVSVSNNRLVHTLIVENRPANSVIKKQKDPVLWKHLIETAEEIETVPMGEMPFFVQGMEALYGEVDINALLEEYRRMQNFSTDSLAKRLELSKKIYQYCLSKPEQQMELRDAQLLFGNDYYYAALSTGGYDTANRVLLTLAGLLKQGISGGYGCEVAKKTVSSGLFNLLNSFESLKALLDNYGMHKSVYQYMRTQLNDPLLMNCVGQIYAVLDNLRNSYSYNSQDNPEALREDLSDNYLRLEKIETNRWMELKNKVQKLINNEINELDQRPVLQVEVLNAGVQKNYGYIFGIVRNIGQETAENVVLQANYDNNRHSGQYVLQKCSPGSNAVFEIVYSTDIGAEFLDYYLNLEFRYNGKSFSTPMCKGTLEIGDSGEPEYPSNLLCSDPNGILFSVNAETGEVYSPEFVGRKKETAALRALVDGTDFERYKSALVYGIRRTGKTTLLNYFVSFVEANRPEIICVRKDCEALPTSNFVQFVFIDTVIDTVERKIPELRYKDGWEQLKQIWYSDNFCADQHPERLKLFYMDLKQFTENRGIYLVIDEIDRLFQRIEESQTKTESNLDNLFGALSEILNSVECKSAVHLLICGSNWLIRYNIRGSVKNQLFQRFGTEVIEIGKLPEEDAKAVICNPYKPYPRLQILKDTLEWIWDYAGGLVWHTKLLGEGAIRRAKENGRCVVYPSDVRMSMPEALDLRWCRQFYEGCENGAERQLIDAMQSLACKREGYVHISRLSELLQWDVIETQKLMTVLKALKVVEQHPVDQKLFRFGQDIYRRFFRSQPSGFKQIPEEPDVFVKKRELETSEGQISEQAPVLNFQKPGASVAEQKMPDTSLSSYTAPAEELILQKADSEHDVGEWDAFS